MRKATIVFINLLSHLPLSILYVLSSCVLYPLGRYLLRYRRGVVWKNLALAFPAKSDRERLRIEKTFYRHLCDVLVETAYMHRMSFEELQQRFQWINLDEIMQDCIREHRAALCYFAHYGNWEWAMGRLAPHPSVYTAFIYHRLHNDTFNEWIVETRSRFGGKPVSMEEASESIAALMDSGKPCVVMAISDQLPKEQYVRHFHRFMGIKTKVLTGTEQLSRRFQMNVYYCRVEQVRRGYYTCRAERLSLPVADADHPWPYTDAYFDLLQQQLEHEPALWLWSHDRWRR